MTDFRKKYQEQVALAHKKGLHVRNVANRVTRDYVGMNPKAAKVLGFKMPRNTIYIDKNMRFKDKYHTLRHELVEVELMKKGHSYWSAHKIALKKQGGGS